MTDAEQAVIDAAVAYVRAIEATRKADEKVRRMADRSEAYDAHSAKVRAQRRLERAVDKLEDGK